MKKLVIYVTTFLLAFSFTLGKVNATSQKAFYGIWVSATKSLRDANSTLKKVKTKGFIKSKIYTTTEWSNLNRQKYYIISTNQYKRKSAAENDLPKVKQYFKGAYIKYTGSYKSSYSTISNGLYGAIGEKVSKSDSMNYGTTARVKRLTCRKVNGRYCAVIKGQISYAPLEDGVFQKIYKNDTRIFPLAKNCKYECNDKNLSRKQFFKKIPQFLKNHTVQMTIKNDTMYEIVAF